MSDQLLDVKQVCNQLGCSESTFIHLVHRKGLPAKKISGQWQITRAVLERWQKRSVQDKVEAPQTKKTKSYKRKK